MASGFQNATKAGAKPEQCKRACGTPTDVFNNLISVQVLSRGLTNNTSFTQTGSELEGAVTVFIGIFILGTVK